MMKPEPFSITAVTVVAFALAIAVVSVVVYYHVPRRANKKTEE
jgi:hypothetical protein